MSSATSTSTLANTVPSDGAIVAVYRRCLTCLSLVSYTQFRTSGSIFDRHVCVNCRVLRARPLRRRVISLTDKGHEAVGAMRRQGHGHAA